MHKHLTFCLRLKPLFNHKKFNCFKICFVQAQISQKEIHCTLQQNLFCKINFQIATKI